MIHCRKIVDADWPAILRIQSEAYFEFAPESEVVMRSKVTHGPETSFVAVDGSYTTIAYCLAHPYPPDRNAVLGEINYLSSTENIYVHDLAVQKKSVGLGVAKALFEHCTIAARSNGYRTMSLVAVQQAASFWEKMGFSPSTQALINDSYPGEATFMTKML